MPAGKSPFEKLLEQAGDFVRKQRGDWQHTDWEQLVDKVSRTGIRMSDEARRQLGNLVESAKHFYNEFSDPGEPTSTPKKKKSAAKAKKKAAAKSDKKAAASEKKASAKTKKKVAAKPKKPKSGAKKQSASKKQAATKKKA